ncbi:MAG: dienelactone hydrolase family protein [Pseudomonadales bacterium]|nr:dienelactone hydrolase family protein [Pseudomonadales bacterium]
MQAIIQDTSSTPDAAVIWLHGLGADGSDFVDAVPYLNLPDSIKIRFVFPSAPVRAVTINNGLEMRSWYDIKAMLPKRVTDEQQLQESVQQVSLLVAGLVEEGISASRIILVGFSQGGAVAYELALTSGLQISGVSAMSTYMPRELTALRCTAELGLKILAIHGDRDDVVPCSLGESAVAALQQQGFTVQWHTYPMAHEVSLPSLTLLGDWIAQQLAS